jgi:hypothetical protein
MRLQLKRISGVLGIAAVAAMLVASAVGTSAAGASEWKTNGTFPIEALGEGLGTSTLLLSEGLNSVSCENSHSKRSFESFTKAKVTITYLGKCELIVEKSAIGKFKEACPNITTNELNIVPLSKLNGGSELGVLVLPASGTELAKFTCTGSNKVEIKVKGGVICESSPIGELSKLGGVACRESGLHGAQEYTSGENPSGATVKTSLTAESKLSIFTVTEKDAQTTFEDLEYTGEVEQTGTGPTYYLTDGGAKLEIRMPGAPKLCEGQILVKNIGPNEVKINKENLFECKFTTRGCENVKLKAGEQCQSVVTEPKAKPEYELEVEIGGVTFKRRFLI